MTERLFAPRGAYVPDWNWGFTAPEARVFAELVRQDVVLPEFVAQHLPTTAEFVEGMARKVGRFGVAILPTDDGLGWELENRRHFLMLCPPLDILRTGYGP